MQYQEGSTTTTMWTGAPNFCCSGPRVECRGFARLSLFPLLTTLRYRRNCHNNPVNNEETSLDLIEAYIR